MNSGFRFYLAIGLAAILFACAGHQETQNTSLRQHIAESYGLQSFDRIDQLQYTFNVKNGEQQVSRFWIWEPRSNTVTFKGMDYQDAVTYNRGEIDTDAASDRLKKIDAWFINDNYWLLFPFHVAWDKSMRLEDVGRRSLPMGDGSAKCVVVSYPDSGGYTPGDVYDLYLDDQYRLTQWVYHRGGSPQPTRITTWDNNRSVGPLVISLNHQGDNENFRVWFTNVGVKLVGADDWVYAN